MLQLWLAASLLVQFSSVISVEINLSLNIFTVGKVAGRKEAHQSFELAEGDGGAVKEVGRKPALVLITVSDRCA